MNKTLLISFLSCIGLMLTCCKQGSSSEQPAQSKERDLPPDEFFCETDSFEIFGRVLTPDCEDPDDFYESIYLRNKFTGDEDLLFTTNPLSYLSINYYKIMAEGKRLYKTSIDSIPSVLSIRIYKYRPLKLIVEGCIDSRNILSFLVDVQTREAWFVPTNNGYIGKTDEGYMIFQSYSYGSDPDIVGRYTILYVFDRDGYMVDSLDFEHVAYDFRKRIDEGDSLR